MAEQTHAPDIAIEFHGKDYVSMRYANSADVAYWNKFPPSPDRDNTPFYIVIRPNTAQGEKVSDRIFAAHDALQVCRSLVDAYAKNGGAMDWSVIDTIHEAAQEILRQMSDGLLQTQNDQEPIEPAGSGRQGGNENGGVACQDPSGTLSLYADRIRAPAPEYDPRHIEGYMRLQYATLDHLGADTFAHEVSIAIACIQEDGIEAAERNAQSYGL